MQDVQRIAPSRIPWIDLAKGVGIVLIVFGHISSVWESKVTWWLYSFHVPLFFLLSGFTFNPRKSAKTFFAKNIAKLVVSYFAFAALSVLAFSVGGYLVPQLQQMLDLNLSHNIQSVLWANSKWNTMLNAPLWFLPCLTVAYIQMYLLENLYVKSKQPRRAIVLVAYLAVAFSLYDMIQMAFWPWHLETSFLIMPFFITGKMMGEAHLNVQSFSNSKKAIASVTAGLLGTFLAFRNTSFNLRQDSCGNLLLFYPTGVLLSLAVILLCQIVKKSNTLEYLGKHTLYILGFHKFVIWGAEQVPMLNALCNSGDTVPGLAGRMILTIVDVGVCLSVERLKAMEFM